MMRRGGDAGVWGWRRSGVKCLTGHLHGAIDGGAIAKKLRKCALNSRIMTYNVGNTINVW